MRCILSTYHEPHFNLAAEEILLKERQDDYFLLYRNKPSVVVGKHQNALAEINLEHLRDHGLQVARRISGGGTVYHDLGNLNFSFITSGEEGTLVDYKKHTAPVIDALGTLGLRVRLGSRNELLLGKYKISGTASHVYKRRALHHGTLLFNTNLSRLEGALRIREGSYQDRAVRSVPSKVTNLAGHLNQPLSVEAFELAIMKGVMAHLGKARQVDFSSKDMKEITSRIESKFQTWEWNYGYSPRYEFEREISLKSGTLALHVKVEKGIIREASFLGEGMEKGQAQGLAQVLVGTIHDPETLRQRISGIQVEAYIAGLDNEQLLAALF